MLHHKHSVGRLIRAVTLLVTGVLLSFTVFEKRDMGQSTGIKAMLEEEL